MAPTLNAPSPGNYQIGKGIMSFKPAGAADWIDLGNCPEVEFTPTIEQLDHFSSREGIRKKDLIATLEQGGTVRIVMEEFTARNLSLIIMGAIDELAVGGPKVSIMSQEAVSGELRFVGTNDVGPRITAHWYNVQFLPSSGISLISDEWGNMEANAEVLVAPPGHESAGEFGFFQITNIEGYS